MTSSEPPVPVPAPPPPPPPGPGPRAALRSMVPIDTPARTNPLTIAVELILFGLGVSVTVPILLLGVDPADLVELFIGLLAIAARAVAWWFRTYTVTADTVTLDEGLLQRRHRVVPLSRIQQVQLRQPLLARIFGLVTMQIETAGEAGSTAISLRSLDRPTAEALRHHLLAEQRRLREGSRVTPDGHVLAPDVDGAAETVLVELEPWSLLIAGATSGPVAALLPVAVLPAVTAATLVDAPALGVLLLVAVSLGVIGVLIAAAGVAALVGSWGFRLVLVGDDLQVVQGLLDKREHTMPRHRLQHVRITDNPLRRRFDMVAVQLHSAASPGGSDQQSAHVTIPLVRRRELDDVLELCMGSDRFRVPALAPRPPAARRRAIFRRTALTITAVTPLAVIAWPAGVLLLPLTLSGWPWGRVAHRRAGSALDAPVVAVASGAILHRLELIPAERVQSARTITSPLQHRVGLATLRLDVAGSARTSMAPGLSDLPSDVATAAMRTAPRRARR